MKGTLGFEPLSAVRCPKKRKRIWLLRAAGSGQRVAGIGQRSLKWGRFSGQFQAALNELTASTGLKTMTEKIAEAGRDKQKKKAVTARQVADYLKGHPDFFVGRDDLLPDLTLPHQRGDAISLVERQVALLRERALDYRHQLVCLADNARDNEKLFERMRLLVLALLESKDLEQLIEVVNDSLNHEFGIEFHSLILFSEKPMSLPVRIEHTDVVVDALGSIMTSGKAICGQITQAELDFLFQEQAENVGSVAIAPLNYALSEPQQLGILALGSKDKDHFKASMGTLFISYLGDILSRILARQLRS